MSRGLETKWNTETRVDLATQVCIMRDRVATLRELRERRIVTQFELARLSGVGRTTIAAIETGRRKRRPHPSTLGKLAKALKVKPEEIEF